MKKRTEIFLEVEEITAVFKRKGWCRRCAREVRMVSPETAASESGLSVRLIYQKLESGLIHYREKPDGLLDVCLPSLWNV